MISTGRRVRADLAATASAARNSGAAPISCSSARGGASLSDTGANFPGGAPAVGVGGQRFEHALGRYGPDQEVGRTCPHCLNGGGDALALRKHDHRELL